MELTSFAKPRSVHDQPDFVHVVSIEKAQELISSVKQTPDPTQLLQLVEQAHEWHIQLFHFAAAIGDREFYGVMMAFLPLGAFMKELLLPNQNGMTAIQCAKTMNPLLATDIETCLLSRGVIVTQSSRGYVVASAISSIVGAPYLKRVDVRPNRFAACLSTASTVGLTLRANGIHYAAARAVYVQQVRSQALDELAFYGDKLLAFAASGTVGCDECRSVTTRSVAWSGPKIADLAKEASFRAKFDIFAPCKNASQQLVPGTSVLLDFANLSPPPSEEERLMILRLNPSQGKPEPKIAISYFGVRVPDAGYYDDDFLRGFRRGWYNDSLYFRCVGDRPDRFLSGGDASKAKRFNIRENHDFGYDDMRVMIELPDEGIVFCRGVGDNPNNPEMACVLFDSAGNVRDRYGYLGKLGRWSDIVQ
ncbi:hypothetical protein PInf_022774 [Phytophthora infestans]|nr:hypothetical protein PInf_022774 [Phytophthora infestans]